MVLCVVYYCRLLSTPVAGLRRCRSDVSGQQHTSSDNTLQTDAQLTLTQSCAQVSLILSGLSVFTDTINKVFSVLFAVRSRSAVMPSSLFDV